MSVTVTDPQLLTELATAENGVELVDPAGRSLGVLTRPRTGQQPAAPSPSTFDPTNLPGMTQERLDAIFAAAKRVGEHPLFEDHIRAVEEYRKIYNTTEPDNE